MVGNFWCIQSSTDEQRERPAVEPVPCDSLHSTVVTRDINHCVIPQKRAVIVFCCNRHLLSPISPAQVIEMGYNRNRYILGCVKASFILQYTHSTMLYTHTAGSRLYRRGLFGRVKAARSLTTLALVWARPVKCSVDPRTPSFQADFRDEAGGGGNTLPHKAKRSREKTKKQTRRHHHHREQHLAEKQPLVSPLFAARCPWRQGPTLTPSQALLLRPHHPHPRLRPPSTAVGTLAERRARAAYNHERPPGWR